MRIGLFGGSFNPIHMGHLIMAEHILEAAELDRIIFIPAAQPPHKEMGLKDSSEHRYKMVELAIADNPNFEITDIEIKRDAISYTVDTVHQLKERYPDDKLYFIIGSDTFYELPSWRNVPGILEVVNFLVVRRPGFAQQQLQNLDQALEDFAVIHDTEISLIDAPLIQISSTFIRQKMAAGQSIRYLVPDVVRDFIEARDLFGGTNG